MINAAAAVAAASPGTLPLIHALYRHFYSVAVRGRYIRVAASTGDGKKKKKEETGNVDPSYVSYDGN